MQTWRVWGLMMTLADLMSLCTIPFAVHVMEARGDLKGDMEEDGRRKRTTLKEEILEGEGIGVSPDQGDQLVGNGVTHHLDGRDEVI